MSEKEKRISARKNIGEIISEKEFLGKEFLTWLWFRSDKGVIRTVSGSDIAVSFERFIMLESGTGEASESVSCRGLQASLSEGIAALASGKKVSKAHIRLAEGDYEWKLTITGATFDIANLKVPKTVQAGYEDEEALSREGRVLERGFMIFSAIKAMDALFHTFLAVRLDKEAWHNEKDDIREWITRRAGALS
jgi:recombination associated protein RdgC